MTSIIAITNLAGGTHKTTAAHSLSVATVEYGKKVLLIDLDPRAELTFNVGFERSRETIVEMLQGSSLGQSNDITTEERFDFIGADSRLASISNVNSFKSFLDKVSNKYDVIIVDTSSQVDSRTAMAFSAADAIVVPSNSSIHSIRGALNAIKIEASAQRFVLPIDQFTSEQAALFSSAIVLDALIPVNTDIDQAIAQKRSVLTADKNSDFAQAYREAAYSLLEHLKFF
jgi:MinD-like ATPase involved in chromosome partitioning or flagellar assembly